MGHHCGPGRRIDSMFTGIWGSKSESESESTTIPTQPNNNKAPGAQQQPPTAQQPAQKQARTYTGKIVKTKTGKYALLTDAQKGQGYFLDDQADARKFDQKNVEVVATLDPQTSTLHVIQIKLAS